MAIIKAANNRFDILIDDEDAALLSQYRWRVHKYGRRLWYATMHATGETVYMHRLIMAPTQDQEVDHIDGNGLNNHRGNLRCCSHAENIRNRVKRKDSLNPYKGVYPNGRKWSARLHIDGRFRRLGNFETPEEAARCYDRAIVEQHGEYARRNFQ
jgi:hypothetical protein